MIFHKLYIFKLFIFISYNDVHFECKKYYKNANERLI